MFEWNIVFNYQKKIKTTKRKYCEKWDIKNLDKNFLSENHILKRWKMNIYKLKNIINLLW